MSAGKPYVYLATGIARDVQRGAADGARVAVHFPDIGRTVELQTDGAGGYALTERPAPGTDGPVIEVARGQLAAETQTQTLEDSPMTDPHARLEYLRAELRAERISLGELIELASLREHIAPGDVELLEAAGVPEHDAETEAAG